MTNETDLVSSRLDHLDSAQRRTGFYRHLDSHCGPMTRDRIEAKKRANEAYAAYQRAMDAGDRQAAEAAASSFRSASAVLRGTFATLKPHHL